MVPALPVTDTVKRVSGDVVVDTVDRSSLVGVQTPQGFPLAELRSAYAASTQSETDDAGVFQAAGGTVRFVPGHADAFKITTPWDLQRATAIATERSGGIRADVRLGLGVDVHAFDASAPCRVGLLDFPGERGLAGHSDGDAVAHAVCDALLSAGGLGDIGGRFGTSDPAVRGSDRRRLRPRRRPGAGGRGSGAVVRHGAGHRQPPAHRVPARRDGSGAVGGRRGPGRGVRHDDGRPRVHGAGRGARGDRDGAGPAELSGAGPAELTALVRPS